MDPQVQAFLDKWAEKSAAKQKSLDATGAAKLAEHKAKNALTAQEQEVHEAEAARQWAIVEASGNAAGDEGRCYAEAFALAEAYVEAHPELQALGEQFIEDHELLVKLIAEAKKDRDRPDRLEFAAKLRMFELVTFERQHIGAAMKVVVRKPRDRGRKVEV